MALGSDHVTMPPVAGSGQVLGAASGQGGDDRARKAAVDFEAVFLSQMLETMTAGLKTDGPFGGGAGEGVFRSMLNQEYGKAITKSGGIGIADAVYREMLRIQENHA